MKRIFLKLILVIVAGLAGYPVYAEDTVLPEALVLLPEKEHAIIVEKKTQTLHVYSATADKIVRSFYVSCSTGEVAGPKSKAGDKKTPEGVYFLKDEYEDRYLTPIYGKKAFPSDYPNLLDLRQGKQGSAIWIHGTDKALKPMDSNGCVALENKNIMALAEYIRLDTTPLIIVEHIEKRSKAALDEKGRAISGFIDKWVDAMATGSYHHYLSFYAESYLPDISWWETWLGIRKNAVKKKQSFNIQTKNTGIYAHGNILVVIMDLYVGAGNDRRYLGKRQLFIRDGSAPKIVGDLFQKRAKPYEAGDIPLVAAARELVSDESDSEVVVETVQQWLAAWSAKDMAEYAAFYASDFYSEGMGKNAWVKRKKNLAKRYDYISVTGKDYKVIQRKDGYEVSFLQHYKSSGFSTQGRKRLKLVRKGGVWKIYRENWKGK
ncbi:MAG: L,D-transpeptidase family protein [Desulfobacterales bacterium]|nr:L,D-transpeptidase family protein [Desulfobacterales bacterium]